MERLPGFRDFYPEPLPNPDVWSADARQYIFDSWRSVARRYGFREYDGPPLESLELFTTKGGNEIVGQLKEAKEEAANRGGESAEGESEPKARPQGVVDGKQVNIPAPSITAMG